MQKGNAVYQSLEEFNIKDEIHPSVLKDECVEVIKDKMAIKLRRIAFYHQGQERLYEFIANDFELPADIIIGIYKRRWQIETFLNGSN